MRSGTRPSPKTTIQKRGGPDGRKPDNSVDGHAETVQAGVQMSHRPNASKQIFAFAARVTLR
jgi:hypothetical protein